MRAENQLIQRDTAVLATSLVATPISRLANEDVQEGTRLMNIQPTDPDATDVLFAAEETGTKDALQCIAVPFSIRWWVAKAVDMPDMATGEMRRCIRLALVSPDLDTLILTSVGAVASLDLIRTLFGDGPYDPAVKVLVKPEKTKRGFNVYRLRLAERIPAVDQ
jgi:hypothetical protein